MSTLPYPPVAVVGSGPSGCFLAHALRRAWPLAPITVFDRLHTPFGLVRYGVSPDHQHSKNITKQFDRAFTRDGIEFAGNIEIGKDISLEELRRAYPIVVLATGLSADRILDIPGADLDGVYGAGRLTRVLNSHPDEADRLPRFGDDVVLIGSGNVAIDVVRFLVKTPEHFDGSDIDDELLSAYAQAPVRRINVISRSPLRSAKADAAMLRELGRIPGVRFHASGDLALPPDADKVAASRVEALHALITAPAPAEPTRVDVTFHFGFIPAEIRGEGHVREVALTDASGQCTVVPADSVITAVGFTHAADSVTDGRSLELPDLESGRVAPGLYRTGWLRRGPRGTIPENRTDALAVAAEIVADFESGCVEHIDDRPGYSALPAHVDAQAVTYDDWRRIEAEELAAAADGRIRRKLRDPSSLFTPTSPDPTN